MGLLQRLLGGKKEKKYIDKVGIYFYVRCDSCGSLVKVRADRRNDLTRTEKGFAWHKTIVDSRCFRRIPVVVQFDGNHRVVEREIDGGQFVTEEEYAAAMAADQGSE